jgi:carboxyl-terminal processing protease
MFQSRSTGTSKQRARQATVLLSLLALVSPLQVSAVSATSFKDSPKALVDEAWQIVNREYVDGTFNKVDWKKTRQQLLKRNYRSNQEAYLAIRDTLKKLGDPYTRFMDPQQFRALTNQTSGEMSGVGIRLDFNPRSKQLTITEAIENSPAEKAGLKAGDVIVAIEGKPTKGMSMDAAVALIRGEVGKSISMKISRAGKPTFDVSLTRAQIEVASVFTQIKQEGNLKIGYIRLAEFSSHSPEQMAKAIRKMNADKVNAFVLDMRDNPGGLLQASIEIARMWMDDGTIVKTIDRKGGNENFKAMQGSLTQRPLAVLVNGQSASASEILAGALKDNRRATIVGSQTFGKALVQSVHALADGSGMAVTVAHYYTPNGTDIGQKGVTPDIRVEMPLSYRQGLSTNPNEIVGAKDPQYLRAISILRNHPNIARPDSDTTPTLSRKSLWKPYTIKAR